MSNNITDGLPIEHLAVIDECVDEAIRNDEHSDVHTEADVAADIVERLIHAYSLRGYNRDDSIDEFTDSPCTECGAESGYPCGHIQVTERTAP